ncbi:MAG TPA: hypothetical protein VGO57_16835 [Verrucomicrobiae bacterium]
MAEDDSDNSVDLQKLRVEAETLISQFDDLADALARYRPPKDAPLKVDQLHEISKTIKSFENRKLPVPDELRNLKTDLLLQTHQFEEARNIFDMVEQETARIMAKIHMGGISVTGDRKARHNSGATTAHSVLRKCIIKSLKSHNGRAKTTTVLNEVGEMLKGKLTSDDLDLDDYNNNPIWRRNACLQRRVMVREGTVKDETNGGYWELTARFAATRAK